MGEAPTLLAAGPLLVIHVIPTQAALGLVQLDPVPFAKGQFIMPMVGIHPPSARELNFDGVYGKLPSRTPGTTAYTQIFRQGFFEAVWVLQAFEGQPTPVLPSVAYESYVNNFVGQVRGSLDRLGLAYDVAVFLSVLGADKLVFAAPSDFGPGSWESRHFDRQTLLLPDVLIPADVSVGKGMRPAYDLMCQSVGVLGSSNYGDDGEWKDSGR